MKKLIFTTMAISALFLSVSCQKENVIDAPKGESAVFTAYVDGATPDSKTFIKKNEQGKTVSLWSGQERIWILNGNNTWKKAYFAEVNSPADKAIFSEEDSKVALSGNKFIAIYPADPANASWWNYGDGNYYVDKLWLKNTQTATPGSYDPSAHIALAYSTTNTLFFKNFVALLKFTAKSANVTSIKVTVGKGEALSGNFSCNPVNEKIATNGDYGYALFNNVELKGTFEAGTDYYMAVLPGTYSSLKLTVNGVDVKSKNNVTFDRNGVYDLGEVYPVCEYGIVGGFNGWDLDNPTGLTDSDGDGIFECKNIDLTPQDGNGAGFKFVLPGQGWTNNMGVYESNDFEGKWYSIYNNSVNPNNIVVSDIGKKWDIYIYFVEQGSDYKRYNFMVQEAGSPAPKRQ